jgi:hypothetical protein
MIFFIQRSTGIVIGVITGRVHPQEVLDSVTIHNDNIPDSDMIKYVVPMEPVFQHVEEPVFDFVPEEPGSNRFVKKQIGTAITKEQTELSYSGPLANLSFLVEEGESAHKYKVILEPGADTPVGYELNSTTQ